MRRSGVRFISPAPFFKSPGSQDPGLFLCSQNVINTCYLVIKLGLVFFFGTTKGIDC